jgi:Family of unknown function (DUF6064)
MLPFTADVLFSSFEAYNRALWPLPILAFVLALAAILLTLIPVRGGDRTIGALLAAAWLWVGLRYHIMHHAAIDFSAPLYGVFFVFQGLLLAWTGAVRGKLAFRFRADLPSWVGLLLALAATVAWPLADGLISAGLPSVRLVGLTPTPTAVFALGLLLLIDGRTPLYLAVIPLLWTLVGGATAWVLAIPQDLFLPLAGLAALVLILWKNRRQNHGRMVI